MENFLPMILGVIPTWMHQTTVFLGGLFVQQPWIPLALIGLATLRYLADRRPARR